VRGEAPEKSVQRDERGRAVGLIDWKKEWLDEPRGSIDIFGKDTTKTVEVLL
jgi:hypothetical protein